MTVATDTVPPREGAIALLVVTMLLWGANMPLLKWMTASFDVTLMSGLRMTAASVPLAWMLLRRDRLPRLNRRQWTLLAMCSVLMVYLNQLLLVGGLARSNATNGSLITAFSPLAVSLLAVWMIKERLTPRRVIGLVTGLAGVASVVLHRPGAVFGEGGIGDLMLVAAVLTFSLGVVLLQRIATTVEPLAISFGLHAVGAVCLLLHACTEAVVLGRLPPMPASPSPWIVLCLSGTFCTGLANLMWNMSVLRIGVARAVAWMYWVPIIGVGIAVALLGEPFTRWHLLGMLLVLGGNWIGAHKPGELRTSS